MSLLPAIGLAFLVFEIGALWRVFVKAGRPGWAALVPFYNVYVLLRIADRPGWWLLLWFVPGVNVVIILLTQMSVARAFGRSDGFGIGLTFLWWLFVPILGYGRSRYGGREAPPVPAAPALSFEQRLSQLEHAHGRLRQRLGVATTLAAASIVAVVALAIPAFTNHAPAASEPTGATERVTTRRLELVDANGTLVARLAALKRRDHVVLGISGADGNPAMVFDTTGGPRLELFHDASQTRLDLTAASIDLLAKDVTQVHVATDEHGGTLELQNPTGHTLARMDVTADDGGSVTLNKPGGANLVALAATPNGGRVAVSGKGEHIDAALNADAGGGNVMVANRDGQLIAEIRELGLNRRGAMLQLYDGQQPGKPVVQFAAFPGSGDMRVGTGVATLGRFYADAEGTHLSLASKEGKVMVAAGTRTDGGELSIFNRNGSRGLMVLTSEIGGLVNLNNADGKLRVTLAGKPNGGDVAVYNQNAGLVGSLGVTNANGHGDLVLNNAAGQRMVRATVATHGGELTVRNQAGKDLAGLGASPHGGELFLRNQAGNNVAALGTTAEGSGDFLLLNRNEKMTAWLGLRKSVPEGALILYDTRTDQPSYHAPP